MKRQVPVESASALIDERIKELGDWRGMTLARVRKLLHAADPASVVSIRASFLTSLVSLRRGVVPGFVPPRSTSHGL